MAIYYRMEIIYLSRDNSNISSNSSSSDDEGSAFSESTLVFLYIFIPLITSVTILGNTLVILAFIIDKRLRNQSNFFLLNLAICDFLVGAFCIPVSVSSVLTGKWTYGDVLCKIWLIADNLMCTASVFNVVLISYDRFFSITLAVEYRSQQKNHSQTAVKIATIWVLSFLLYSPAIIVWDFITPPFSKDVCVAGYYDNWHFLLGASTFDFFIPLTCIIFFNISIYWNIRKRSRKTHQGFTPSVTFPDGNGTCRGLAVTCKFWERKKKRQESKRSDPQSSISVVNISSESNVQAMKLSRDKKVAQSLMVLVCVFGICWAPYTLLQVIRAACHDSCIDNYWNQVTSWMLWLNSSVNPVIYPLCHKSFRDALVKMSQKCKDIFR